MRAALAAAGVLAAALLASGCAAVVIGAGGVAAVSALEDRRTAGAQIEDEANELRGVNRIAERYPEGAHVNVTSFNRMLLLTGEVPDAAARDAIEKIAAGLPNARSVANELEVAGVSSLAARSNDSLITSKVKLRFIDANRFSPLHVKVVTEAGVAYLMGIVTEQEGNDAAQIARTTGGVRKVVKVFEYCKPSDEACRPPSPPAQKAQSAR
ncbi:MAG: BON domain-containing protein [Betaproteobacteria bacterium]